MHRIDMTITLGAAVGRVWSVLTEPGLMVRWLSDQDVRVECDWRVRSPITISGDFHGRAYVNKGTVLAFEPQRLLRYTSWSSLSEHPDLEENYSVIELCLAPQAEGTLLTLAQTNLVTPEIFGHWRFYWRMALHRMKLVAEEA